ncbi:hypothetical protein ACFV0T_19240 [Streptomyces sp. NPDC059582]|uniref:hypothetical protein n=1 Tax=Streptomyces sp. NPDC059582 TaxID=3346875 RepID=UPI0036851291
MTHPAHTVDAGRERTIRRGRAHVRRHPDVIKGRLTETGLTITAHRIAEGFEQLRQDS